MDAILNRFTFGFGFSIAAKTLVSIARVLKSLRTLDTKKEEGREMVNCTYLMLKFC